MSPKRYSLLPLVSVAALWTASAAAQFYNYGPGTYYPRAREPQYADPYYVGPDEDYAPRQRARKRRLAPTDRALDDAPDVGQSLSRRRIQAPPTPADADPAFSSSVNYDDEIDPNELTREIVSDPTGRPPGTITIDTQARKLYLSLQGGQAVEYGVGVGRDGFAWKGEAQVGRKAFWPGWTPPKEMLLRRPELPEHMEGGLENPLGARAIYLFKGDRDTLFRIHGTNEPDSIGKAVSSGCIRMLNADVIDLYSRIAKGARVVVL